MCVFMCSVISACLTLCDHMYCSPRLLCPYDSPGKDTGVGCHALLQGIFPTQGSNSCLLASPALRILYSLSHLGCALVTRLSKMIFKYFSWVSQKMSFFFQPCQVMFMTFLVDIIKIHQDFRVFSGLSLKINYQMIILNKPCLTLRQKKKSCFWKQPLSTTKLSPWQVLRKHLEGSAHSTHVKRSLACKVYLQEPCSLNKRFLPQFQEFKCYYFLSEGTYFTSP